MMEGLGTIGMPFGVRDAEAIRGIAREVQVGRVKTEPDVVAQVDGLLRGVWEVDVGKMS